MVCQCVLGLLDNATKFTQKGEVTLSARREVGNLMYRLQFVRESERIRIAFHLIPSADCLPQ